MYVIACPCAHSSICSLQFLWHLSSTVPHKQHHSPSSFVFFAFRGQIFQFYGQQSKSILVLVIELFSQVFDLGLSMSDRLLVTVV